MQQQQQQQKYNHNLHLQKRSSVHSHCLDEKAFVPGLVLMLPPFIVLFSRVCVYSRCQFRFGLIVRSEKNILLFVSSCSWMVNGREKYGNKPMKFSIVVKLHSILIDLRKKIIVNCSKFTESRFFPLEKSSRQKRRTKPFFPILCCIQTAHYTHKKTYEVVNEVFSV